MAVIMQGKTTCNQKKLTIIKQSLIPRNRDDCKIINGKSFIEVN